MVWVPAHRVPGRKVCDRTMPGDVQRRQCALPLAVSTPHKRLAKVTDTFAGRAGTHTCRRPCSGLRVPKGTTGAMVSEAGRLLVATVT